MCFAAKKVEPIPKQSPPPKSWQHHNTLMRHRRHQEEILHLHRCIRRLRSKLRTLTLPEKLSAPQPQFHVSKVNTETDARARSEWVESFLRSWADFVVEPAGWEESRRIVLVGCSWKG